MGPSTCRSWLASRSVSKIWSWQHILHRAYVPTEFRFPRRTWCSRPFDSDCHRGLSKSYGGRRHANREFNILSRKNEDMFFLERTKAKTHRPKNWLIDGWAIQRKNNTSCLVMSLWCTVLSFKNKTYRYFGRPSASRGMGIFSIGPPI